MQETGFNAKRGFRRQGPKIRSPALKVFPLRRDSVLRRGRDSSEGVPPGKFFEGRTLDNSDEYNGFWRNRYYPVAVIRT